MEKKPLNRVVEPDEFSVLRHENTLPINLGPGEIRDESPVCDATVHVWWKPLGRKSGSVNLYQISGRTVQRIAIALSADKAAP
jgi:hypothetical protein